MRLLLAFLVLIGCNDSSKIHHLPDAPPPPDGAPDAAPDPVTLTITKDGAPVAGVHVYFQATPSAPAIMVPTGADGVASAQLAAGGYVTAVNPYPTIDVPDEVRTFAGTKPGDQLRLDKVTSGPTTTVTLIVPPDLAAANYDIATTCGATSVPSAGAGSASSVQINLVDCHGTADVAVVARGANGQLLHALYHPDVAITDGGTVDLTADTYQAVDTTMFAVTHAPAALNLLQISSRLASVHGVVVESLVAADVVNGSAVATMTQPTASGTIDVIDTFFQVASGRHHVVDWGAAAATHALDLTGVLLPDITVFPTYDPTMQAMVWTPGGTGATPDFAIAEVLVARDAQTFRQWDWRVAAPSAAGTVVFPTLPTDAGDYMPNALDSVTVQRLTLAAVPGGYDAVRARILDVEAGTGFVAGPTGRAVAVDAHLGG